MKQNVRISTNHRNVNQTTKSEVKHTVSQQSLTPDWKRVVLKNDHKVSVGCFHRQLNFTTRNTAFCLFICKSSLYILGTSLSLDELITNISSRSMAGFLISLLIMPVVHQFFTLMSSDESVPLQSCCMWVLFEKYLLPQETRRYCPMLFSRNFIVLWLTFKPEATWNPFGSAFIKTTFVLFQGKSFRQARQAWLPGNNIQVCLLFLSLWENTFLKLRFIEKWSQIKWAHFIDDPTSVRKLLVYPRFLENPRP